MSAKEDAIIGDSMSFASLIEVNGPMIRRIAGSYEADPERRRELEQEMLLAIWRGLPSWRNEGPVRAFLARVAHNRALTHVSREAAAPRRSELDETLPCARPSPHERLEADDMREKLIEAVRTLPLSLRQPASLTLEGFSPAEIGEMMGLNANAVSIRLTRARAALRSLLNPEDQG